LDHDAELEPSDIDDEVAFGIYQWDGASLARLSSS